MLILKNRILIRFDEIADHTPSGLIIIPDICKDPNYTGTVIAIGPEQMTVKVGDRVVFSRYCGVPIKNVAGQPMEVVVDESEVLAVVVDEELKIERETIAITGVQLQQMLYGLGYVNLTKAETKITYVNYSHEADTLYVTVDKLEYSDERRFELQLEGTGLNG